MTSLLHNLANKFLKKLVAEEFCQRAWVKELTLMGAWSKNCVANKMCLAGWGGPLGTHCIGV